MTIQRREVIIYNGLRKQISNIPKIDFGNNNIILNDNPLQQCYGSSCWRGYIGTWAIINNMLYLINLTGKFNVLNDQEILADWYTGNFIIHDDITVTHHREINPTYDNIELEIENGIVLSSNVIKKITHII